MGRRNADLKLNAGAPALQPGNMRRREFIKSIAAASALAAVADFATPRDASGEGAYASRSAIQASMGVERIARFAPLGYQSKSAASESVTKWVQVDLGQSHKLDQIKLLPMLMGYGCKAAGFPRRFRIEASDESHFAVPRTIVDCTQSDYPPPDDKVAIFNTTGHSGRYVRLTATLLSGRQLALSKLEVWSFGHDVAEGCPVSDIDSMEVFNAAGGGDITPAPMARGSGPDQATYEKLRAVYPAMPAYATLDAYLGLLAPLTRKPRPQGEGVVTDNPGNIIAAHLWKPIAFQAVAPLRDVKMHSGLFANVMENNIHYLLDSFSVGELLRPFRTRAGKGNPPGLPPPIPFWDTDLPGSNAGRFMMGAGNALRWMDAPQLRRRLHAVVAGIAECQEPNGYAMAYHPDTIFYSERGNYTRSWVTHGLVDAGYAGHQTAFHILRGYYDWFDQCPYLPELLRRAGQGVQGMIANTRTYFTPIGQPKDLHVVQRYYQENYWLEMLAQRNPAAIWQYPYDHPHCYLLTSLTPYLDQYRATGEKKYLDAVLGGWELYHTQWQHIGGAISICEGYAYPPKSAFVNLQNGENCGSSFWLSLNHGLHQLYPNEEKYANEIEKSIYNVLIANQDRSIGIRYHTNLNGQKEIATAKNTCCEGQGTRQLGSLPQYLYSLANDGLFVNLFANSTITSQRNGIKLRLTMRTKFPFEPVVNMHLTVSVPVRFNIRVRIPTWAAADVPIHINGTLFAAGKPGTYQAIDRIWSDGDTIALTLPMTPRLSLYTGIDQMPGGLRYGIEYGPVLLAVVGAKVADAVGEAPPPATAQERAFARGLSRSAVEASPDAAVWPVHLPVTADEIAQQLQAIPGRPLHFAIDGVPEFQYVPYFQINSESFTCFPVLKTPAVYRAQNVGPDDLALSTRGATATSDSELASEPGCTAKIIDGTIATPANFGANRWHSANTPHPHWVEITLRQPEKIGTVIIHFADPLSHPTSFQGIVRTNGRDRVIFDVTNYQGWRKYEVEIAAVTADKFRLVIRDSASPLNPHAAQISQVELYPPQTHRLPQKRGISRPAAESSG